MSNNLPKSNIGISSNVCLGPDQSGENRLGHAADHIPGDLMVELLGTRDSRWIEMRLTPRQRRQYLHCRFFAYHGMDGLAYEQV